MNMNKSISRFILPALALLVVSCAGAKPGVDHEPAVKARAADYWQHRTKGEIIKAYSYESPPFREGVSLDAYYKIMSGGLIYISAQIKSVAVQGDTAVVVLDIRYKPVGVLSPKKGLQQDIRDHWQLYDGEWYHRFKPAKNKPSSSDM